MAFAPKFPRALLGLLALLCLLLNAALAQQGKLAPPSAPTDEPLAAEASYRIRKGDRLSVRFLYHPDLNEPSLAVRPDGFITLQIIGEVKAEGLTAAELQTKIEQAYNESLLNPVISVSLLEFKTPRVFVGGQVARPGSYELRDGKTMLQAVILAGGFTPEAHRKMVLHARPAGERELQVTAVDMTKLLAPGGSKQEELLQDGDYIFVPDSKLSKFARVMEAFRFAVPGISLGYSLTPNRTGERQ
jgi:polysaccharide export outer membrane protein